MTLSIKHFLQIRVSCEDGALEDQTLAVIRVSLALGIKHSAN
jgi:hypothetical protein